MPVIPKKPAAKPQLVNRGPAGLLTKVTKPPVDDSIQIQPEIVGQLDDIRCVGEVVDIDSIIQDPNNARLHPERNMEAIKDSLKLYGQTVPLVVRRETKTIVAGNGRHTAAKDLGWTKIAISWSDMDEIQATGYGLADNRTAELAKWDFSVVARLDKLLLEANQPSVGWSLDELEVLRAADWTPPPITEGGFGEAGGAADPLLVSFNADQYGTVGQAIQLMKEQHNDQNIDQATCLELICSEWLERKENAEDPTEAIETIEQYADGGRGG